MQPNTSYRAVAIIARMRSGSNLLERILGRHPDFQISGELFNPHFIGSKDRKTFQGWSMQARNDAPMQFLNSIAARDPRKLVFRLFSDHLKHAVDAIIEDPTIYKIVLSRDPLASYISLKIAQKSGHWRLGQKAPSEHVTISFDAENYRQYKDKIEAFENDTLDRLASFEQSYSHIDYSALLDRNRINEIIAPLNVAPFTRIIAPIRKQNSVDLRQCVTNPEALPAYTPPSPLHSLDPPIIPVVYYGSGINTAYMPILGNPHFADIRQIRRDNQTTLKKIQTDRLERFSPPLTLQLRIQHPFMRCFSIFEAMMHGRCDPWGEGSVNWLTTRGKFDASAWGQANYTQAQHKQNFLVFLRELHFSLWLNAPRKVSDTFLPQCDLIHDIKRRFSGNIQIISTPSQDLSPYIGPNHLEQIQYLYGRDFRHWDWPLTP